MASIRMDEDSQDGRPFTRDSNLLLLLDFTDFSPGISLISNICKPILPDKLDDALLVLNSYVTDRRRVGVK